MWPSSYVENLQEGKLHERAAKIAKIILGDDMTFDFDMLISKAPLTDTVTPMHQDESYWCDMPDKRAVTVWVAMDNATVDNGCMWFVPGSHNKELRPHRQAREGHHVLCCDGDESEMIASPIRAGSCTLHHGRTIHYTRGNSTDKQRRAFIVNYRPGLMVTWERNHGYDHGKDKSIVLDKRSFRNNQTGYNAIKQMGGNFFLMICVGQREVLINEIWNNKFHFEYVHKAFEPQFDSLLNLDLVTNCDSSA
ncbi:unnamed protein product [Clavelina lepadiformis]|uniref:Phytanoyl-CoA dioxygenase family protein n=1 Tax=Clavelina lepadiformis TaxID=159417 RepID=A0ABP0F7T0_CLALP